MKINIGNILSNGDNLKLIKDSINVLEYKNTVDEVVYELNRGCNLVDDIFYRISFPPSSIETLNPLANLIFVKGYIYTDLFQYLYDNLKYYYEQLESIYIEEFIENGIIILSIGRHIVQHNIKDICSFIYKCRKHNNLLSIKKVIKITNNAFSLLGDCNDILDKTLEDKYSEFLTNLSGMCTNMLHINIEEEKKDEN